MIRHLYIKNFVLIDELNLDLDSGFSVFTGETGAGKSILVDAICILCADRASSSYISKGKESAIIEGTFTLQDDTHARKVLEDAGLDCLEETTFTREISSSGKSTARIDRRIVTLALMKDCLKNQIDIHNQRDSQYLLDASTHIHLLDQYLQDEDEVAKVSACYETYQSLVNEKEKALTETYNQNDLEYFQYEIDEIDHANLKVNEEAELEDKEKKYHLVKNSFEKMNSAVQLYDEALSDGFDQLNRQIQTLADDSVTEPIKKNVNDSYDALTEAMDSLRETLESFDISEDEINAVEERLYNIQRLKRKYGGSIQEILNKKEDLIKRTESIQNRAEYLKKMDKKILEARKAYDEQALILSRNRRTHSAMLDTEIAAHLKDLALANARFHTDIKDCEPTRYGSDRVEFLISMNKGEDLKPLSKTASGGELSRLMLGLKESFTRLQGIHTIIFDEIDSGVSGQVASAIGSKMHNLSKNAQVFAVTHLSPVAAWADHHYLVSKSVKDSHTITTVDELNKEQTIKQLAMIATGSVNEVSLKAAEDLYSRSRN